MVDVDDVLLVGKGNCGIDGGCLQFGADVFHVGAGGVWRYVAEVGYLGGSVASGVQLEKFYLGLGDWWVEVHNRRGLMLYMQNKVLDL